MNRQPHRYMTPPLAVVLVLWLILAGCDMGPDTPQLSAEIREWYPSQEILIPFEIWGGSEEYAEYRYEYDAGEGWVVGEERTVRIAGDDYGLIEFTAEDPGWNHRITMSALGRTGPGQPLEPYGTIERYFGIDNTTPSADPAVLELTATYSDDTEAVGPTYLSSMGLRFTLDHPEFDAPSGSPVAIFLIWFDPNNMGDPQIPGESGERYDPGNDVWVWGGGGGPYDEYFRAVVVDAAGNRSAIRQLRFYAP